MKTKGLKGLLSLLRAIGILVILFSTGYFLVEVFGILEWLGKVLIK